MWFIVISFQQHPNLAISKPSPFRRDLFHFFPDILVVRRAFAPDSFWINADQAAYVARAPLSHKALLHASDRVSSALPRDIFQNGIVQHRLR
ncbi:MAG: hypothetical protein HRT36_06255 [Alphaproteobacteria bacterium]|nr:hypothetical protein [Alphaproteobacteria bacterium]